MSRLYLVHLPDGTEYGPIDRGTLVDWHGEGRLPEETLVWPEGAPSWLSVSKVLGDTSTGPVPPAADQPSVRAPGSAPGSASGSNPGASGPRRSARAAAPAAPFPLHRLLLAGGTLLVGLVVLVGLWAAARPWVARRLDMAAVHRHALPDRRIEDKGAGVVVELPSGWVALRPGNPYVQAAEARLRLARPALGAFAALSSAIRPRLVDALDAHLDAVLQARLPRQPSTKEAGRADVQLGRGRGRLVRTVWDDGLVAMQGATVTWADGYELFALEAWAPAAAGAAFTTEVEALCRGITPVGALGSRVDAAVDRLALEVPELSRDALRLLVAERMSQGGALDDVPQLALVTVSRGLDALTPAEQDEMRTVYQQVWAPVPEEERVRLAALLAAVKAERPVPPEDLARVREAVKAGALALPPPDRERLQELSGRAVRRSLLAP